MRPYKVTEGLQRGCFVVCSSGLCVVVWCRLLRQGVVSVLLFQEVSKNNRDGLTFCITGPFPEFIAFLLLSPHHSSVWFHRQKVHVGRGSFLSFLVHVTI